MSPADVSGCDGSPSTGPIYLCRISFVARKTRDTQTTRQVLIAFLDAPGHELHGYGVISEVGMKSGTVYPMLVRLEGAGVLESRWEDIDPNVEGRRPRRLYKLTADGIAAAQAARDSHVHEACGLAPRMA